MIAVSAECYWRELQPNDHIICPSSGRNERVIRITRRRGGEVWVRTDCHDHVANSAATVTRVPIGTSGADEG